MQHRGDAGHQPGQAEQDELDAPDPHAGELRGDRVVADREDAAAEARAVQDEPVDDRRDEEEHQLERDHPPDIALAEEGEARRIALVGLVAEDDEGDAAEQAHRADGDDDRGQAEPGDQQAVEGAAGEPDQNADGDQPRRADAEPAAPCPSCVEASAMIAATERSISPAMISSAMASAIIAFSVKLKVASDSDHGVEEIGRGEAVGDEDGDRHQRRAAPPRRSSAERSGLSSRSGMCAAEAGRVAHAASAFFRMMRPCLRSPRALRTTARMMALPEIAICQNGEMLITGSAVCDDAEEQRAEHRAADRADAAGDRDAADDAGGDDVELVAAGDLDLGDDIARDPEIAAEPGDQAGDAEGDELGAADIDAGIDRRRSG